MRIIDLRGPSVKQQALNLGGMRRGMERNLCRETLGTCQQYDMWQGIAGCFLSLS